jgi:hypothetical protein
MTPKEIEALHARVQHSQRLARLWELAGFGSFVCFVLIILFV